MDVRKRTLGGQSLRAVALLAILALLAVACGGAAVSPSASTASQAASASPAPSASEGPIVTPVPGQGGLTSDGRPLIRWFVGLGTGERPNHIEVEQAVVDKFNNEHDPKHADYVAGNTDIVLSLEIYRNAVAYDTLATQIATGNAPDIIGPIGVRALQSFGDQLLDLSAHITKNNVDLSEIPQGLIDVYNVDGKQIGIPMAVYPVVHLLQQDPVQGSRRCLSRRTRSATVRGQGLDLGDAGRDSPRS